MPDEFRRKRKLTKRTNITRLYGWGTWIRTKIDGVTVRCSTVELSPTRWKAKFGRMDVSEARLLEVDRKAIARRNTLALVTPTERADYHLSTPLIVIPLFTFDRQAPLLIERSFPGAPPLTVRSTCCAQRPTATAFSAGRPPMLVLDEKNALSRSSTIGTIPATVETSPLYYR